MTNLIHYSNCPLCNSPEMEHFTTTTDNLVSGRQFDIMKCPSCGFLFTQDVPSSKTIGNYYESENYQPHNSRCSFTSFLYRSVRSVMFRWKYSLIRRHHKQPGTLIDVGAGSGHFMAYMKRRGWQVIGCEQSGHARVQAWRQWQLLLDGDVMSCDYSSDCADVITAWHAIEHIHDLHGLWERFGRWLKHDGLLVIAVPNCDSLDANYYDRHWAAWDTPRHLWHFNADTMTRLGQKHGFKLINIHSMPLDACYISILSGSNWFKAIANGLRLALLETIHRQQASSLVFLFRKNN